MRARERAGQEAIATPLLSVMPFPPLLIENRLAHVVWHREGDFFIF